MIGMQWLPLPFVTMDPLLQTPRLALRQMAPSDGDDLLSVFGDSDTMKYYQSPFTRDDVAAWIQRQVRNYAQQGYGLWAVTLAVTGEVIGDCGLTWQKVGYSEARELECGYHVRKDLWNLGLATEAARACRDYARDVLGQKRLIAIIAPQNLSSQAVARKLGMLPEREDILEGKPRLIFGMRLQ
jgi:RimJ/RimL family protein N-acetyltransferase